MNKAFVIVGGIVVVVIAAALVAQQHGGRHNPMGAAQPATAASPYVNVRCPMMPDNVIDPAKVTPDLTREFKGQKVAFCCAGLPGQVGQALRQGKTGKTGRGEGPHFRPSRQVPLLPVRSHNRNTRALPAAEIPPLGCGRLAQNE